MEKKETTALVTTLNETQLGQIFVKSGFFADAKDESQAIVKILAGREAGLQPIESMTGIHIIKGKITFGANMMAAAVKKSGRYDYRVTKHTTTECTIDFYEIIDGKREVIGTSSFTIDEAKQIGLTANTTWKNYPKAMLFARALSSGVRYYCPDVFGHSPVYVPEEMGANVNEEGEPIDITPQAEKPTKQPKVVKQPKIVVETQSEAVETSPIVEHAKKIEAEEAEESQEPPELKEIPCNPMPYLKNKDNVKDALETPSCDLQLPPSIIEKVKDKTPREAFDIIDKYAFSDGQGKFLKAIVMKHYPEYFENGLAKFQIPESALMLIMADATGMIFNVSEKTPKCKGKGCKNILTEPEAEKRDGLCRECFKGDTED